MTGKIWFCGLLAAAITICGCGDQVKTGKETAQLQQYHVKLQTSAGDIVVALDPAAAPVTVKNFLGYVRSGFYNGTIFHRVIHGFMIQGGGFTPDMVQKDAGDPIANEAGNGLKNLRGTIAMARGSDPDSATCQFYINHVDNPGLDFVPNANPGYAVFGRVIDGMDVVDAIARVDVTVRAGMPNVPIKPITIKSARIVSQ